MFFTLSKILTFLISPFTYIIILLVSAWITKNSLKRKKLLSITVLFIFIFGNSFILDEACRLWELPENNSRIKKYDIGVLLGGMIIYDNKNDIIKFNSNVDRLLQTLPKLQNNNLDYLIFSGGSGDIDHPENKEAGFAMRYLNSINFPTKNIFFENESRNTYQNAKFSKKILSEKFEDLSSQKILLITSSLHMRRSLACFKKEGLSCDYLSSNRKAGPRKFKFQHCLIPNISALSGWNHLAHEIIGYITYSVTGRI
jgi:uncharacterized SAM-binding protein YcdF (DUF218 family)